MSIVSLLPILVRAVPVVLQLVPLVERLIKGPKQGAVKREIVVEAVKAIILAAEGISGKDFVDEALFAQGVGQIVDGVVAVLNATGKLKGTPA